MKFRFYLLSLFLFIPNLVFAGMTGQVLGQAPELASGNTSYQCITAGGGRNWGSSSTDVGCVMPVSGTFSNFQVALSATSGTGSRQFTIFKNGVAQAIDATITNATTASDTTHSFSVVAGDIVSIRQITTGTLNSVSQRWALQFDAANVQEYPLLQTSFQGLTSGAVRYLSMQGDQGEQSSESNALTVMPTDGTISKLYVQLSTAAVAGSVDVVLRLNGGSEALTCSVAISGTTCNDTSHSVDVVAGDTLDWEVTNNGSASPVISIGVKFAPDVDGESVGLVGAGVTSFPQNFSNLYMVPFSGWAVTTTESQHQNVVLAGTIKKMRVLLSANVGGSGQTWVTALSKNGSDSALTCSIASGAATGSDTSNTVSLVDGDLISSHVTTSATTGNLTPSFSYVIAMTQPATPTPTATPTPSSSVPRLSLLGAG